MMKAAVASYHLLHFLILTVAADELTDHQNWNLIEHKHCGVSFTSRIIGGTESPISEYPWVAKLGYINPKKFVFEITYKQYKCGGSLISILYVLTAAHCVSDLGDDILAMVRLGDYDRRTTIDCDEDSCAYPPQDIPPKEVTVHEDFRKFTMKNDIALIRLKRPAELHSYVSIICLPYGHLLTKNHMGEMMEVVGWGLTNVTLGRRSVVPLTIKIPIVDSSRCDDALKGFTKLGEGQLCGGGEVGRDSCGGDSGGPMMDPEELDGPSRYFLTGVISFGEAVCGVGAPAVYTDVATYMTWILDHIRQ